MGKLNLSNGMNMIDFIGTFNSPMGKLNIDVEWDVVDEYYHFQFPYG
jgi:hypothetical protein